MLWPWDWNSGPTSRPTRYGSLFPQTQLLVDSNGGFLDSGGRATAVWWGGERKQDCCEHTGRSRTLCKEQLRGRARNTVKQHHARLIALCRSFTLCLWMCTSSGKWPTSKRATTLFFMFLWIRCRPPRLWASSLKSRSARSTPSSRYLGGGGGDVLSRLRADRHGLPPSRCCARLEAGE